MRVGRIVRGMKAGGYPGLLVGVLSLPINYYLLAIKYRQEISDALGKPYYPSVEGLVMISLFTALVFTLCGILYTLSYRKLPFKKPFWKAFIFGLIIYVMSRIGDLIYDYPVSPGLTLENALWSAPQCLLLWPYLTSRIYRGEV